MPLPVKASVFQLPCAPQTDTVLPSRSAVHVGRVRDRQTERQTGRGVARLVLNIEKRHGNSLSLYN